MSRDAFRRSGTIVMTLPSNSSTSLYPANKASDYRVQLPAPLTLDGDWEVGLTGFNYNRTWFNVPEDGTYTLQVYHSAQNKALCTVSLPSGHYRTPQALIEALNGDENCSRLIWIDYADQDQRVTVSLISHWSLQVTLSPDLAVKLGWSHEETVLYLNEDRGWIKSPGAVNLDEVDMIFVNCDLAADSHHVGDQMVPLLKTISPSGAYGDFVQYEPMVIDWLPLRSRSISLAHVLITDATGRSIPFESGRCSVRLHIRRSRLFENEPRYGDNHPILRSPLAKRVWPRRNFQRNLSNRHALGQECRTQGP